MTQPTHRKDGKPRRRPLLGVPSGSPRPTVPPKADEKMEPSKSLRYLVRVRGGVPLPHSNGHGWMAFCRVNRCKFAEVYATHNGAQSAAKRHRLEKQYTKLHGATERITS